MITCNKCGSKLLDNTDACPICKTVRPAPIHKSEKHPRLLLRPWLVFFTAFVVLVASFFHTPMSSGVPASFGNILQPLVWACAAFATLLAGIVLLFGTITVLWQRKKGNDSSPSGCIIASEILLLILNLSQLIFALYGPDI